jgi:hypothetical protein
MFADDNSPGCFAAEMAKDLGGLAIKAFAKLDVHRDRLGPPVAVHMSILPDVTHEVGNFPDE